MYSFLICDTNSLWFPQDTCSKLKIWDRFTKLVSHPLSNVLAYRSTATYRSTCVNGVCAHEYTHALTLICNKKGESHDPHFSNTGFVITHNLSVIVASVTTRFTSLARTHIPRLLCTTKWRSGRRVTRSPREPWAQKPGPPPRPAAGAAGAAAAVGSAPCASPRRRPLGTHALGPGSRAQEAPCRPPRTKGRRAEGAQNGWEWPGRSNL